MQYAITFHSKRILGLVPGLVLALCAQAQITREWVATYNGEGDRNDRYTCVVKDVSGNLYLGGSVTNSDQDRDYLLVKLNSAGAMQWRRELNGEGDGSDEVTALAIDASGNLLATGFSKSAGNGTDYRTVKYDPSGILLWSAGYNNPTANGYDQANAVAVDGSGNVIVTGQSDGDPGASEYDDYTTVKYSAAGSELWVVRFDGLGGATDRATGLGVDAAGNIYVTGRSDNGSNDDYATIKYNGSGVQQWLRYGDRGGRDRAVALVLDGSTNVYVTGRSDNGNDDDLWTIKYDASGNEQWNEPYDFVEDDRAIGMAIDADANVYVLGQSDGDASPFTNWDFLCVAYNSSGSEQWDVRYDGPASNDDLPTSISTDGTHVLIVGASDVDATATTQNDALTRSYGATDGVLEWSVARSSAGGLDDDARAVLALPTGCVSVGNISVATADRNAVATRYDAAGAQQWEQMLTGIGDNNENIRALAVDASGNINAAGYSVESRENRNMALWKVASDGTTSCAVTFNGTSPASPDEAQGIALTDNGDAIVAGFSKNSGESNNITCFRSDAGTCDTAWTEMVLTPANGSDKVYDLVRDAAGDLFMTGRIDSDPSYGADDDAWTAKLSATGTLLWSVSYNSGGGHEDRGSHVRVSDAGNVYVTGRTWNGNDLDILVIKYNANGAQQWIQTHDGGNGDDEPAGLEIDANEDLLITANTAVAGDTTFDLLTLRYNSAGAQQWAQVYDGAGSGDDLAAGLAIDNAGNAYVAGTSDVDPASTADQQMLVVKYDQAGALQWARAFGNPGTDDHADDIAVNTSGQTYVTGHTNSGTVIDPDYDASTLIWSGTGDLLWSDTYAAPGDSSDIPARIVLDGDRFYIGGFTSSAATMRDMMLIKYTGTITGITEAQVVNASVMPTVFQDALVVNTLLSSGKFELYDAVGSRVFTRALFNGRNDIALPPLAAGAYSYRISMPGAQAAAGKLVHLP